MQSFITINGTKFPQPRRGLELLSATIVDSARNANGVVVGQKVGRDQQKLNNLFWGYLTAEQWSTMLQIFDKNFFVTVTYPDMVNNRWTSRKMYPGDRTATRTILTRTRGFLRTTSTAKSTSLTAANRSKEV